MVDVDIIAHDSARRDGSYTGEEKARQDCAQQGRARLDSVLVANLRKSFDRELLLVMTLR